MQNYPEQIKDQNTMSKDYSNQNLQNAVFNNVDLSFARFVQSDIRGANFNGSNLTGADFTNAKTGITTVNSIWIFLVALVVSMASGYIAMLAGHTVQQMLASTDTKIRYAGWLTIVLVVAFILYYYFKGGKAIRYLILPVVVVALLIALLAYLTGAGTGMGMVYLVVACLLVTVMFVVGTVSRAAAGTLSSNILFILVALGGGLFGKSVGGGIGSAIMALSCAMISKKALKGAKGFESLQKIAHWITLRFGTSFRNAILSNAIFHGSTIRNTDFSHAVIDSVDWVNSKKVNCIIGE